MEATDFITIGFGLMALFVTAVGIFVTTSLTKISHIQASDAYRVMQMQQFETTFFNLLNAHCNSAKNLTYWYEDGEMLSGDLIFETYKNELVKKLDFKLPEGSDSLNEYEDVYSSIYSQFMTPFDCYLNTLDTIAKFVERKSLPDQETKFYYSIIASQLDDTIRALLQYHIKLYSFEIYNEQHSRIKKILWRTGTIGLSDYHDFTLDTDIQRREPESFSF